MHIRILGSAAGGGFPQWNCNHPNSRRARNKDSTASPRTQSSLAISSDREHWFLCNASPDLRQQINENPILQPQPAGPLRTSPIAGVVLTNADVDHIAGLLNLRESQALQLYATGRVIEILAANPIFQVLNPKFVQRRPLQLEHDHMLCLPDGSSSGLLIRPFAVPGKVALWLEEKGQAVTTDAIQEDTIALEGKNADGKTLFFYIPGCASMPKWLQKRLWQSPLLLFDGTLWQDDEMIISGVGQKTGQRMGHLSLSGPQGSIATLQNLGIKRKIFVHLNTTNPVLLEDSPERSKTTAAGWEIAYDGMELSI
jgi:pyrroloquinoline quinone biosynthesis protein B